MARLGLVGQLRIGQQGPSHDYGVGIALDQDVIGEPRIVDLPHDQNRHVHHLLDGGCLGHIHPRGHPHAGQHPVGVVRVNAPRDLKGVYACLGQLGRDVQRIRQVSAAGHVLVAGHAHDDREVLARLLLDVIHHFQDEPQPPVNAAAVLVGALVAQR